MTWGVSPVCAGPPTDLIWAHPDQDSGGTDDEQATIVALLQNGVPAQDIVVVDQLTTPSNLCDFTRVWVLLGTYQDTITANHVMTQAEGQLLADYLTLCAGNMYVQGGDHFWFDPIKLGQPTAVHDLYGIDPLSDGGSLQDLTGLNSGTGLDLSGLTNVVLTGENVFLDHIAPDPGFAGAAQIWIDTIGVPAGVVHTGTLSGLEDFRLVMSSFEVGAVSDASLRKDVLGKYLQFFGFVLTPPPNDEWANATPVALPSVTSGRTIGAGPDPTLARCDEEITSAGVWYSVLGTGTEITASTCGAVFDFDTKINIYCGTGGERVCVASSDDDCVGGASGSLSTATWCSQLGVEYLILIHGFGDQTGYFEIDVFESGGVCTPSVQCLPVGACCFPDGTCEDDRTDAECLSRGGVYQGDRTQCGLGRFLGFTLEACSNPFEDIGLTGTVLEAVTNNDEGGELAPIGFDFSFYGDVHTQVGVSANGYLTFGNDLTDLTNDPIPDPTDPNDLIAPYWDDWNPAKAGTVYVQTLGVALNRRCIVQWDAVEHFEGTGPSTFQALLFEGSQRIEFRYGTLNPNSPTIGVENSDGTEGLEVLLPPVAGDCIGLAPEFDGQVVCEIVVEFIRGDADADGALGMGDAITLLDHVFGVMATTCLDATDANADRMVDVSDPIALLAYLYAGGRPPPAPFPGCGPDPDRRVSLGCDDHLACP